MSGAITVLFLWVWNLVCHIKEGRRLRVFESKVLRKLFDPTSDDLKRERRRLHNDELNDLHSS